MDMKPSGSCLLFNTVLRRRHTGAMDDGRLDELDWVVWNLQVWDPGALTEPDVGTRTAQGMTQMAASFGCVFDLCCDDDAVDGVPYYSWLVRVPRAEHLRRNDQGIPVAVAALHAHLRTQVPAQVHDWQVHPDRTLSFTDAAGRVLRRAYGDLLDPLEAALLGFRRDGAQDIDPEARCWCNADEAMAGTYTMWLSKDPDVETWQPWLLIHAGLIVTDDFWSGRQGQGLRRFGVTPGSPVLLLPRPAACQWMITVTTGTFMTPPTAVHPRAVGASYRWTSRDGGDLAHRVATDLAALFPGAN